MAISWLLKDIRVTSVLVGASSTLQLMDNVKALANIEFTKDELTRINKILV